MESDIVVQLEFSQNRSIVEDSVPLVSDIVDARGIEAVVGKPDVAETSRVLVEGYDGVEQDV